MKRIGLWVLVLGAALLAGCLHPPLAWSPDGRWLAYTLAVRPKEQILEPWWLLATGREPQAEAGAGPREAVARYRLWTTRVADGASVLLEDSPGPLTSPAWKPDGTALAFGRIVRGDDGHGRYEVVIQDAPDHRKVMLSQAVTEFQDEASHLPAVAPAWSPNGRTLAVPRFHPQGLALVRVETGAILTTIEGAYLPSWSPDGTKLAFLRNGETESLGYLDATTSGPPRHLADLGLASQPPLWSRDGKTIVVARRRVETNRRIPHGDWANLDLIRVTVDTGQVEPVAPVFAQPFPADRPSPPLTFAFDQEGENLFAATGSETGRSPIVWYRAGDKVVFKRLNPFDTSVAIGAVSLSPTETKLAIRVGRASVFSPPALCDPETDQLTPLLPDDDARLEWLATIVEACRKVLRVHYPAPSGDQQPIERPTLLPLPGERAWSEQGQPLLLEQENELVRQRLQKLAGLGRPLCERPSSAARGSEQVTAALDEARLFFDYLLGDYEGALAALDAVQHRADTPDRRERLLKLRAQIYLGMKDVERARGTIAYLKANTPHSPQRLEWTPAGPVLTREPDPGAGWTELLAQRAAELEAPKGGPEPEEVPPAPVAVGGQFGPRDFPMNGENFALPDRRPALFPALDADTAPLIIRRNPNPARPARGGLRARRFPQF